MATIYRLEDSTLYLCEDCLNELGPIPGKWKEEPLDKCSVCGEIDLQTQEEMHQYSHDMEYRYGQSYEEDQLASDQELWEAHIRDPQSGVIL